MCEYNAWQFLLAVVLFRLHNRFEAHLFNKKIPFIKFLKKGKKLT